MVALQGIITLASCDSPTQLFSVTYRARLFILSQLGTINNARVLVMVGCCEAKEIAMSAMSCNDHYQAKLNVLSCIIDNSAHFYFLCFLHGHRPVDVTRRNSVKQ